MTKILITTFGTRGDIQPFIALGKGLKSAGYEVALCTSEGFQPWVEEHRLTYLFMNNELLRLSQAVLGEASGLQTTVKTAAQMLPAMRRSMDDEWNAAREFEPDLIVYHPKCFGSFHVAEKLNKPAIMALPLPLYTPTRAFPIPFMAGIQFGRRFNRFSYQFIWLPNVMYSGMVNNFREATLGLSRRRRLSNWLMHSGGTPVPVLYPYSQHLLPVPDDFPDHVHVTGYWFLEQPESWQPDPKLVDFLTTGTTPIAIGFGSMGGRQGEKRAELVLEALEKSGQRAVLVSGWGGLKPSEAPANVFMVDSIPHDWLFPKVAAVVHHGGAGTTAAGLRAGKPTIICPFMADQPFWGKLVYQQGVGAKPIPQSQLTAERQAEAIVTTLHDSTMNRRTAELGEKIRAEDGTARAAAIISDIVN